MRKNDKDSLSEIDGEGNVSAKNMRYGIFFGLIAAFIWGVFPVVTRFSLGDDPGNSLGGGLGDFLGKTPDQGLSTYDIAALRFIVVGPLLIPILWRLRLTGLNWLAAMLLVIGAGAPYLLFAILGLQFAPAAHFGTITPSSMLIFSAIGSWLLLGETFTKKRIIGTLIIILGILMISWEGLASNLQNVWLGDLMFCFAGLLWAIYTITLKKYKIEPLHAIAIVSVISMVLYLPPYFLFGDPGILRAPLGEVVFQGLFQGILSVLVALLLYSKAVAILGAARGAIFGALVPTVALLMAIPVLNEIPTIHQLLGIALVTSGMLLALGLTLNRRKVV